jgi:hypothetical protein
MNDRPLRPIQEDDQHRLATASRFAHSLYVTYPSFEVWRSVYDPRDEFHRFNNQRWGPDGYQSMRQDYSSSVTPLLNRIHSYSAGSAVLRQLQVTNHVVEIYPKLFMAAWEMRDNAAALTHNKINDKIQGDFFKPASTEATAAILRAAAAQTRRLERVCLGGGREQCTLGTGEGVGVNVFFDPHYRNGTKMPEDTLVHELTHAGRYSLGIFHQGKARGIDYEEFMANLIENIFRSERGAAPLDYSGAPINPKTFLTIEIRNVISELSRSDIGQPAMFRQLANIQCNFNPIRDIARAT